MLGGYGHNSMAKRYRAAPLQQFVANDTHKALIDKIDAIILKARLTRSACILIGLLKGPPKDRKKALIKIDVAELRKYCPEDALTPALYKKITDAVPS